MYFVRGDNLWNDHRSISKEYISYEPFWGSPKQGHELMLKAENIIPVWRFVISNRALPRLKLLCCPFEGGNQWSCLLG